MTQTHEILRLLSSITTLLIVYPLVFWCFKTNKRIKTIEDDLRRNAHCRR